MPKRPVAGPKLAADARNRALRTFLVNIGIDVGLAVAMVLLTAFQSANAWGDLEWTLLGFSLFKTAVTSTLAYILRLKLDPSKFPTPLPADK